MMHLEKCNKLAAATFSAYLLGRASANPVKVRY